MSRDIRSYFQLTAGSKKKDVKNTKGDSDGVVRQKKRSVVVLDSDSDEDIFSVNTKKHKGNSEPGISKISGNHAVGNAVKKSTNDSSKLEPVDAADFFGNSRVKKTASKTSTEIKKDSKDVKLKLEDQHLDPEFEATLRQLDEQECTDSGKGNKKTAEHLDSEFEATLRQLDERESIDSRKGKEETSRKQKEKTPGKHREKVPEKHKDKIAEKHKDKSAENHKEKRAEKFKEKNAEKHKEKTPEKSTLNHKEQIPAKKEIFHTKENNETPENKKRSHITELSKFAAKSHKTPKNDRKEEKDIKSSNEKVKPNEQKINHHSDSDDTFTSQKNKSTDKPRGDSEHHEIKHEITSPKANQKSSDDSFSEDAFEKKRLHAMQYQRYLQREGPKNPGGKEIPEGKPNCLKGLVFVVTGVLETIDRDEASSLIQRYGGRVTSNVSRNTSYLVVGDEPGPSKIEKATKLNTKQLTEDGLLDLIRTSSGSPKVPEKTPKSSKKDTVKREEGLSDSVSLNGNKQRTQTKTDIKTEEITSIIETEKKPSFYPSPPKNSAAPEKKPSIYPSPPKSSAAKEQPQHFSLWADKYKPVSTKQIIGQQGDRSNVKKLLKWLGNWHSNHSGKKKLSRPSPWAKDDSGAFFKAALLSGPPGVGKTTTAHLVCKELGFDVVEFNASDTRSKRLLHEEVSELLNTKSLSGYFKDGAGRKPTENHVLVMDEVDGMAGNEDRGGMQELIQLIKNSRVPIICMCNDRHHPKVRSLTNYCFDLQFSRPRVEQIRGAMMSVCFKEGIKISPDALNDVITGANHDVRQVLHHLSMWSVKEKQLSAEQAKEESQKAKKNIKLGPWDVLKKVFSADAHKTMSIFDKSDLFFHDYSLGPLFVQENYLSVMPHKAKGNRNKHLELVAKTSESLSTGDLVEKSIRSRNAWSLLPVQAMASSVLPGQYMEGHLTSQINFPAWLGKNSRRNKFHRLLQELHMHMRLNISGSKEAVNLDYLAHMRDSLVGPLVKEGADGVAATLSFMQNYYLTREDLDSILELSLWPNQKDPMSQVESKVKAALTRGYNKEGFMTPYSIINVKKLTSKSSQDMEIEGEEAVEEDDEDEGDISNDAMIKAKKRPASSREPSSSNAKKQKTSGAETKKKSAKGKGK